PDRVQRGARHHARVDHEGRLGHCRVPRARGASRAVTATPWRSEGRGDVARGAREARDHARGGDVRRRRGAALRVCGEAARRAQGTAERPERTRGGENLGMCRSIHTLYNVEPAASEEEARAAALQFVRKISGYRKPSRANEAAFEAAVDEIASISWRLL